MLLRSTLEEHVPVREDEVALSEQARIFVFRGSYILPIDITGVYSEENSYPGTRAKYPYLHHIVKHVEHDGTDALGGLDMGESVLSKSPAFETVIELGQPGALQRANHIESIARKAKLMTVSLLAATSIATYILESGSLSAAKPHVAPLVTAQK